MNISKAKESTKNIKSKETYLDYYIIKKI